MTRHIVRRYVEYAQLDDRNDIGWPWEGKMTHRFGSLYLTNCPNMVIPAAVQIDHVVSVSQDGIWFEIIMDDDRHYARVRGMQVSPDSHAKRRYTGRALGSLVQVRQLTGHPLMTKIVKWVDLFDVEKKHLAMDIELAM